MLEYTPPVPVTESDCAEFLAFAVDAARAAGAATLPFFRASTIVDNKLDDGRFDPVTEADRAAEQVLRESIRRSYPQHGILGEEFGHQAGNGLTWVIDPVDGTRAFMSGFLHWGVLLALFDGQRPVLGVMYQPFTGEIFLGDGIRSEYRHGASSRELRVSGCRQLENAVLATTSPEFFQSPSDQTAFDSLEQLVKLSRYGGDCYIYAMLAMGYVDIACDGSMNPYDIQALIPIIEGAGGAVGTFNGRDASMGGTVIAAASRELMDRALAVFSAAGKK